MKKLLTLFAVLLLMTSAVAEEAVYFREIPQYTYINRNLFTEESYPEVCLTTSSAHSFFAYSAEKPLFVMFPGPAGALASDIRWDTAHYLDVDEKITYTYRVYASDSYEEFLNKASQDAYILLDGSDKTAAYIDPSSGRAYGMIGVTEFGKSAKLRITINMDSFGYKMPDEMKVEPLSTIILAEVARVKAAMRFEQKEQFWSTDAFAGIKTIMPENEKCMVKIDFPKPEIGGITPTVTITDADYYSVVLYYSYGADVYVEVTLKFDTYSSPVERLKKEEEGSYRTVLPNGSEWVVYVAYRGDDGKSGITYISKALTDPMPANGDTMYLVLRLDYGHISWSEDELLGILAVIDESCTVMNVDDDPYVPQPRNEEPASAKEAGWK